MLGAGFETKSGPVFVCICAVDAGTPGRPEKIAWSPQWQRFTFEREIHFLRVSEGRDENSDV